MIQINIGRMYQYIKARIKSIESLFADENFLSWSKNPDREKLRLVYDLNPDSIVFDLGGYEGQWASDIFSMYLCKVYVFEPIKKFADDIKKRFFKNSNIKVFNIGLGGATRDEKINLADNGSSIFGSSDSREEIHIEDIFEFISKGDVKKIDLIKLNIEGSEYEVLERLIESGLVKNITDIQVQFHRVAPDSEIRMIAIQKSLSKTHKLTYQYKFVWENWRIKSK